ncbi:hypothetical protein J4G37_32965, partial [Microvirga sp. 3-52]|nr:hypothetical protein [Microvirga sp. 3-52]
SDHLPPTLFLRCCGQLAHVHMFHPADLGRLAANFKITQAGSIDAVVCTVCLAPSKRSPSIIYMH